MSDIILNDNSISKDTLLSDIPLMERLTRPIRTEIDIYEDDVYKETVSNRVVVTGAMLNGLKLFGIESPIKTPTYNDEMNLDNKVETPGPNDNGDKIVCLFCCDDSGCGSDPDDIYVANFIDRIKPDVDITDIRSDKIFPFRFVDASSDISSELKQYYFGKKTFPSDAANPAYKNKIAYYFKRFSTEPQLHVQYADGTQVIGENIYRVSTTQACEVYIETQLVINKDDFKDYFEQVITWPKARVSSVSLVHAWYTNSVEEGVTFRTYQDITPYTKLNFSYRLLQSLTSGLRFIYRIYY